MRKVLLYGAAIKKPIKTLKNLLRLQKCTYRKLHTKGNVYIKKNIFKDIRKSFCRMILCMPDSGKIIDYFCDTIMVYKKKCIDIDKIEKEDPILVCVVKNDLERVKALYEHNSRIGVNNYVFIDNGSSDGTMEFLEEKDNVDIISVTDQYYTLAREAWINRVLFAYGYDRWYLVVDSDEIYQYIGSEKNKIKTHIKRLIKKGIKRERSLMVDMYAKEGIYYDSGNFLDSYRFFDINTYRIEKNKRYIRITGGPRERIFKKSIMLGKYPLFRFERGDIQANSHFTFPFYKNFSPDITSVLLHYKFTGQDYPKYKKRAEQGNYYNGSDEYKEYTKKTILEENTTFYYEESAEYTDSNSLRQIKILKEV